MNWVPVIAYLVDLVATFLSELSYILMKKGMMKVEKTGLNGTKKKSGFCTWEWLSGWGCLTIASLVHISCLPFCDLVVLSTNSAIAIVLNDILSVAYLGEKVVWAYDVTACSLIVAGSLAIVFLSSYSETTYTPDDIKALLWSSQTLAFAIFFLIYSIFSLIQFTWHKKQLSKFNKLANTWLDSNLVEMSRSEDPKQKSFASKIMH